MKTVSIKDLYRGMVPIRDSVIKRNKGLTDGLKVRIQSTGETVIMTPELLNRKVRSDTVADYFSNVPQKLNYYPKPSPEEVVTLSLRI